MGLPMASNLLKAGYLVFGYDIDKNTTKKFSAISGQISEKLKDCPIDLNIIITMLPSGEIVKKTILSFLKIQKNINKNIIIIDMSSSDPIGTRDFEKNLAKFKIKILDAPVSGGVKKAISGKLSIMVAGHKNDIKKIKPILSCMGSNIIETGKLGSAHAMKAINNYVSAIGLMAASEAVILGKKFGIKPNIINHVLNISSGKNNSTENKMNQFVLSKTYSSGFSLSLMSKDILIAHNLSKKLNITTKGIGYSAKTWSKANNILKKNSDHTEIFRYLEKISTQKK